ncbi:MAG: DUF937 domain-containing protein [Rhizobiaceae bacterium]|nr:DUF937 domain-containing protein [Rhizobiaceae bacterium]
MQTLFDMLAGAQNGAAAEQMARQFGLTQKQAQDAMEALMPAFSQGLKRNASDPHGVGAFLSALSTGQHAKYFEDMQQAFQPSGVEEGNGILGHLFGSKEVSRAVAKQAEQATGIGQEILKQMLPVLASMIMGGLYKQSAQPQRAQSTGANPLGEIMDQMMRQGGMRMPHPEAPQPGMNPFDNPFGKALEGMFGGNRQEPARAPQSPYGDNPLGQIFEEMMRGGQQRSAPEPKPRTNPSGRQRTPYDDLFGQMFEAGAKTRDDYQKGVESIFDQYLKGMERRR